MNTLLTINKPTSYAFIKLHFNHLNLFPHLQLCFRIFLNNNKNTIKEKQHTASGYFENVGVFEKLRFWILKKLSEILEVFKVIKHLKIQKSFQIYWRFFIKNQPAVFKVRQVFRLKKEYFCSWKSIGEQSV